MVITLKKSRFFPTFSILGGTLVIWSMAFLIMTLEEFLASQTLIASLLVINFLFAIYILMKWNWESYEIEVDSLTHTHGVFIRQKEIYALENINTIAVKQHLIGMFFGFGNIRLYSPFSEEPFRIIGVPNPFGTAEDIEKIIPGEIPIKALSPELLKKKPSPR